MSVNLLKLAQNATSVLRRYFIGIASVFFTDHPKGLIVNASTDLTRSPSLQYFTTLAVIGACGHKEQ